MPFSKWYQPRYAVYSHVNGQHILVARYGSIVRAIVARDTIIEAGGTAYLDVNS